MLWTKEGGKVKQLASNGSERKKHDKFVKGEKVMVKDQRTARSQKREKCNYPVHFLYEKTFINRLRAIKIPLKLGTSQMTFTEATLLL
jgi:hypothetical protein